MDNTKIFALSPSGQSSDYGRIDLANYFAVPQTWDPCCILAWQDLPANAKEGDLFTCPGCGAVYEFRLRDRNSPYDGWRLKTNT